MTFWIVAAALAAMAAALLALALLRRRGDEAGLAGFDLSVYRDQLAAVDRDLARGTVTEDEADRLRIEIKRRILEADRGADDGPVGTAPRTASLAAAALAALAVVGGSLWLYGQIGAPGYPDLPLQARLQMAEEARANRPAQAVAEAELPERPAPEADPAFRELMDRLRTAVAERPDELQGQELLARNEARLGRFAAAHEAQAAVLRIKGADATAADYADYADLLILAAGGYVSPEAERALEAALARDPRNGTARYYMGVMHMQTGRPDRAFRVWRALLEESGPEAPWVPPIRAQIMDAARRAGVDYTLPSQDAPARGPSTADIEAAEDMSPEARMEMIRGMVSSLSERLATEGGPPEDWARLIRAHGVLGNRAAAAAIWAEAQQVFDDPVARIPILRAARDAGVAQ